MAGFIVSAALSEDETWDAALRYAGEFASFKLAAGVGYSHEADKKLTSGSASIMHIPSGAVLERRRRRSERPASRLNDFPVPIDSARMWRVQGGVEQKSLDPGKTTLYAEYRELRDVTILGDKLDKRPILYGWAWAGDSAGCDDSTSTTDRRDIDTGWARGQS